MELIALCQIKGESKFRLIPFHELISKNDNNSFNWNDYSYVYKRKHYEDDGSITETKFDATLKHILYHTTNILNVLPEGFTKRVIISGKLGSYHDSKNEFNLLVTTVGFMNKMTEFGTNTLYSENKEIPCTLSDAEIYFFSKPNLKYIEKKLIEWNNKNRNGWSFE
jgi:hypothetical protein